MSKKTDTSITAKGPSPRPATSAGLTANALLGYGGLALLIVLVAVGLYFLPDGIFSFGSNERPAPRLNAATPPGPAPDGMVWVPGGEFYMGVDESIPGGNEDVPTDLYQDARHVHKVYVDGFWMDQTEVTNAQFQAFVDATNYVTVAERTPNAEDFPEELRPNLPAKLEPFSLVYRKPAQAVRDVMQAHHFHLWWEPVKGASWRHPDGPEDSIKDKHDWPVVHICWFDAVEYCKWAKKRLPTEAEWEFAARGKLDRAEYCWGAGDFLQPSWMCNAWQGYFPNENLKTDGFAGVAPVKQYPPNGYGLYDMAGNVWEWCSDWYIREAYLKHEDKNPKGPTSSFDMAEPGTPKRVQRGGSYLCADNYCRRYVPGARGKGEPTSAACHIGFRTVRDAKAP